MDVQVQRAFIIPPSPSEPEKVPFTVFDLLAPTYHYTVIYAFSPPNPTNDALLDGLTTVLRHFPLLTASLHRDTATGRPFFVTGRGGAGALVVEATVPAALYDHLPLAPSSELVRLHAPLPEDTPHMLQVQVNRFDCGGMVVGLSTHHGAADGYSTVVFLRAWADTVRGNGVPPLDRAPPYGPGGIVPRSPPRCEFEHRGAEFLPLSTPDGNGIVGTREPSVIVDASEITNMVLHYTSEFIEKLKASVGHKYTKFETLSAHLWKKITMARGRADDDTRTTIHVTVNGRPRLGADALAKGFFGNAVLTARSGTSARDVACASLADVAALVRKGVRAVDARYFQSLIDFGAVHGDEELEPVGSGEDNELSPDMMVDSWMHLEMHRLDFGRGGRLAGILPTHVPGDGVVFLIPSFHEEGGVDAFVAMWEEHAKVLERIAYTMD